MNDLNKKYEEQLKEFAELAVRVGINIQKGQLLTINAPVSSYEFVRMIVDSAYRAGAGKVIVSWNDDECNKLAYLFASDERLKEVPEYILSRLHYQVDQKGATLSILSPDPEVFKDVDPQKIMMASRSTASKTQFYREFMMASRSQWSIIAYPNATWAKKIFPDLTTEEAMVKLMEAILYTSRVKKDESAVENWQKHIKQMDAHNKVLNDYRFEKLIFQNSLGTNLEVQLVENHIWAGAAEQTPDGIIFAPNIPTEESFTMPHAQKVNGTVVSTKPLSYQGKLINQFKLTFKDGKVIDFESDSEYETLKELLNTDEGSRRLGEVALISNDSPISNLNVLFYNTLFDENASCHLALGNAYPMNMVDGVNMNEETLIKNGYNKSTVHVDFMFGSADMKIDGITHDKKVIPVFRKGNFVI